VFDRLLRATARSIPDPRWRAEVVEVARRSAEGAGLVGRTRELAAAAAFGLRLRSDLATGGDGRVAGRHGALLGAALLLAVAAAGQLAETQVAGAGAAAAACAGAVAASLATAVVGRWRAATGLAALALVVAEADAGRDRWDAAGRWPASTSRSTRRRYRACPTWPRCCGPRAAWCRRATSCSTATSTPAT
jgi:hypothetical protein